MEVIIATQTSRCLGSRSLRGPPHSVDSGKIPHDCNDTLCLDEKQDEFASATPHSP